MSEDTHCLARGWQRSRDWNSLSPLKSPDLPPYTGYSMPIFGAAAPVEGEKDWIGLLLNSGQIKDWIVSSPSFCYYAGLCMLNLHIRMAQLQHVILAHWKITLWKCAGCRTRELQSFMRLTGLPPPPAPNSSLQWCWDLLLLTVATVNKNSLIFVWVNEQRWWC